MRPARLEIMIFNLQPADNEHSFINIGGIGSYFAQIYARGYCHYFYDGTRLVYFLYCWIQKISHVRFEIVVRVETRFPAHCQNFSG